MTWPASQDYNEAVQSPSVNFADPDLKRARVTTNAMGLPMPYSGNFADVYQFVCPDQSRWAVKCFTREVPSLRERYEAIGDHLRQAQLPFTVDFTYLGKGILVAGQWYPVLKMEWVEGLTLNQFVARAADKPGALDSLLQIWARMGTYLWAAEVAHADLQHGNVLLVPGADNKSLTLKLVDYDGMWLPALADRKSGELGHPSYQHPQRLRKETYSRELDRFPLLLVATALRALQTGERGLWQKYNDGDNLLFTQADLQAPTKSRLFLDLLHSKDAITVTMATQMIEALRGSLEAVPLLQSVMPEEARPVAKPASMTKLKAVPASKPHTRPAEERSVAPAPPPARRTIIRPTGKARRARRSGVPVYAWVGGVVAVFVLVVGAITVWPFLMESNRGSQPTHGSNRPPLSPKPGSGTETRKSIDTGRSTEKPPEPPPPPNTLAGILSTRKPLYQDKFDNPQSGWPKIQEDKSESWYADELYHLKVESGWKDSRHSPYQAPVEFACEVVGRLVGQPGNGWGLKIVTRVGDKERSLRIALRDGKVGVGTFPGLSEKEEDGPQFVPVRPTFVNADTEWNTLLVAIRADKVEVHVNGVRVRKPFPLEWAVTPADFWLQVLGPEEGATAEFRRFAVWSTEGLPAARDDAGPLDWEPRRIPGKPGGQKENDPPLTKDDKPKDPEKPKAPPPPAATDQIRETLKDALHKYNDTKKDLDETLQKNIELAKDKAQKKGDKKAVDRINAERVVFEKYGLVPLSIDTKAAKKYHQDRDKARETVRKAYDAAERDYNKAEDEKKANEVEKEYKEFLNAHPTDAFQKGVVWSGNTVISVQGTGEQVITYSSKLTVLERNQGTFRARFEDGETVLNVTGNIDNTGKMSWLAKNVVVIQGGQGEDHSGRLDRGAIGLNPTEFRRPGDKRIMVAVTTLQLEMK